MPGALDGVVVADFSRVLAGPYATMLLGDLGAEVVKVERPETGDDTRAWGPPWLERDDGTRESTYFLGVNRNKRSVAIDLSTDEGQAAARDLVADADVLVENFVPGTMERFGLGYDALHAAQPRLVYASITGFGAGEGARLPGYDLLVQAAGGLMSVTGPDAGSPTKVGVALVDVITGLHCAVGVLAALTHRDRTGEGQRVEVNLLSSVLSALVNQSSGAVAAGAIPAPMGNRHPSIAPYETFMARDRMVVLAVGNDGQFRALCEVLGLDNLVDDERFATNPARVTNRDELAETIGRVLATADADHWFDALGQRGVPCGPVNDVGAAIALAEDLGLHPVVDSGGVPGIAHPVTLSATPPSYRLAPPRLGDDSSDSQR